LIKILDDGAGVDLNKIKSLAISKQLYTQKEVDLLTQEEILLIIFRDAFSTSQKITIVSGRGVGLASILKEIELLNGKMKIKNNFGKGIEFIFKIPFEA
jgi:two-component system chemotaxis sensor kinase CheA